MAGGEIYRVEIPIIVDDQSEAPLERARERVNRFQQTAERANERIRRLAAREHRLGLSVTDRVSPTLQKIQRGLIGVTRKVWKVTLEVRDRATDAIRRVTNAVTSPLALLGAGAGLTGAIAFPLKLAGEMEQAQIAMEFFTESAKKGQKFLERLQAFAAKTPFEFPDVRQAAIGLMPLYKNMYGVDKAMDETIRTIRAFGDAAGYTGAGIQGMNLALLGFRQIGTMGKLSMEELRQVTENLLIPMDIVLKELGLTGDALEDLGKRGIPAKTAMEAIVRALEKNFAGGMEKMSKSLLGLTSTVKDTARLTVTAFGAGMAEPVRRVLLDITGLTDYTSDKYKAFQKKLEDAGRKVGERIESIYNRLKQFWSRLSTDPEFQKMGFGDKLLYLLDLAIDKINKWLDGEGGKKMEKAFEKIGSIAARAWLRALKGTLEGAATSLGQGNFLMAGGMLGLASMLGLGLVARTAWGVTKGVGKGALRIGKWLFGKLRPATTAAATAEEAATGAKTAGLLSRLPKLSGVSKVLGRLAWPLAILGGVAEIATAKDRIAASGRAAGALGGAALGAKAGAAIGTAVMPGAGTAVGGVIGGLVGGIAGALSVEALVQRFNILKQKASEAWDTIKQKANEAWTWITTNITLESLAEKVGYIYGYLEGTIFNAEWWLTKWESVKAWTDSAWAGMVNTWNSVRETIGNTIFNAEWWLAKWEDTKTWASNAWSTATEIWESVKTTISDTLFNKKWWLAKWEAVKNWASGALEDIGAKIEGIKAKWKGIKSAFETGRKAGQQAARRSVTAHAYGGILTRPHLGLVAEAGPEAIIPLSASMRSRALALWMETGRLLGVRPYAEGGIAGTVPVNASGARVINVRFDMAGLVGQVVVNNQADIDITVDRITESIADNLRAVFQNMLRK